MRQALDSRVTGAILKFEKGVEKEKKKEKEKLRDRPEQNLLNSYDKLVRRRADPIVIVVC